MFRNNGTLEELILEDLCLASFTYYLCDFYMLYFLCEMENIIVIHFIGFLWKSNEITSGESVFVCYSIDYEHKKLFFAYEYYCY